MSSTATASGSEWPARTSGVGVDPTRARRDPATPPPRRVLHVITQVVPGGAQDNTFVTCELTDPTRFEVSIAANPDGRLLARAEAVTHGRFFPIPHLVRAISPAHDPRGLIEVVRLLRRERFDLMHAHSAKAGYLCRIASRLTGTPCVYTYHGFPFHDFMPSWQRRTYVGLERAVRGGAAHYITLSERDRTEAIERHMVPADRSTAIYTGIDLGKVDRVLAQGPGPDPLPGVPRGQRVVAVGRLEPQKAPLLMVDAFARVHDRWPEAQLVVIGDGELRADVERAVRGRGLSDAVHLLGYRTDVLEVLQHCDVFAFSSLWEAMGRSMVEAMLTGLPVVAPAIYGIPEVVEHGVTGRLYPVGDAEALAGEIGWLFGHRDEAEMIAKAGARRVRGPFDARVMVRRIEEVYDVVLDGDSTRSSG